MPQQTNKHKSSFLSKVKRVFVYEEENWIKNDGSRLVDKHLLFEYTRLWLTKTHIEKVHIYER
jgi:hypothetical protein